MSAEEGGGHDERWVISYADLVTLLFGFFIILFASAEVKQDKFLEVRAALSSAFNVDIKEGSDGVSPVFEGGFGIVPGGNFGSFALPDTEAIRSTVERKLDDAGLSSTSVDVIRDGNGVVIRLSDRLLFPSASAQLSAEAEPLLKVVAEVLRGVPNDIRVEGHSDNVPVATSRYPTNWELSSARATSVLRFLVEEGGVEAKRVFAAGYAEFRPVASNVTPEGRAQNRRADIVLVASNPPAALPTPGAAAPALAPIPSPVDPGLTQPVVPQEGAGH